MESGVFHLCLEVVCMKPGLQLTDQRLLPHKFAFSRQIRVVPPRCHQIAIRCQRRARCAAPVQLPVQQPPIGGLGHSAPVKRYQQKGLL
ncbi:hypothetical protein RRG08_021576 [Elysia crispata]|uniref:Uncharacterized protein n=1 Tax=Elysia crispata TaxID=231223 RepID=A0AAE0XDP9_9GAST|nr:hypothetical protein RRG08_021576 [Elysia crispata]